MKKIFFAASYQKREEFKSIYTALLDAGFVVSAPIYDYHSSNNLNYISLMNYDFEQIDACDIVLADVTYKEIGVGIELGYAKAKNKPIVYIHRRKSELSTTVLGSATKHLEYDENKFETILAELV